MDVYHIPSSPRIKELVSANVITIGVHITGDGQDVWARSTQPHPRLGVTTHDSYTLDEIEALLMKVVVKSRPTQDVKPSDSAGDVSLQMKQMALGIGSFDEAARLGEKIRQVVHRDGVKNLLPGDSLSVHDFDFPPADLYSRTCYIVQKVGTPIFVSRISSSPAVLGIKGAANLGEWWEGATPHQRFTILTRGKRFPNGEWLHPRLSWLNSLEMMPCPFRDPETQVGKEEGLSGEEDSQESSSPGAKTTERGVYFK